MTIQDLIDDLQEKLRVGTIQSDNQVLIGARWPTQGGNHFDLQADLLEVRPLTADTVILQS